MTSKEFAIQDTRYSPGTLTRPYVTWPYCECERIFDTLQEAEALISARVSSNSLDEGRYQIVGRDVGPWTPVHTPHTGG